MTIRTLARRFGTDLLGYTCLVLVLVLGPLPGPGGIPLLLAGLGLLSVHNPWAKRLLVYAQKHSKSFRSILFPHKLAIQRLWDGLAVMMLPAAVLLAINSDSWVLRALSTTIATLAVLIVLSNRSRLEKLQNKRK